MRDDGEGDRLQGERELESQSPKEQARSTHEEARKGVTPRSSCSDI